MLPGARLGRYTIGGLLGQGGMGSVYRATDSSLGRDVALKVLPADVATDPERLERFRREARALAALNHPHIVTIYSVEQEGDVHFLTMELVVGQALDRLISSRALPIERVRQIAHAVTAALSAAHEKGIIHRDLKPANIVLNDTGQTKVLDFGLAKVRTTGSSMAEDSATQLATSGGVALGTPAYMSPEQVAGLDVDQRTDIFSLGVLLYEMVTGVRPFSGRSTAELTSSILRDAPKSVTDLKNSVPAELARVIMRCLEKNASERFASMAEVRQALQPSTAAQPVKATGPSVAVLPFKNLSADPDGEFFSDGLAEEILNALTQIEGLHVAARASSFSFKGRNAELAEVGTKLQVATVLDGSVRRAGNRIRVTVQLVDVSNGYQLWSERYDRELADVFDVQDEIARAIAGKLKVTLAHSASDRLVKQTTASVEAYELYLRGRALLYKRGRHVTEGAECLKRAVALDPEFAVAWAGLADTFSVRGYWGAAAPGDTFSKALTAARRAAALDPNLAEAHCALAVPVLIWERDYERSHAEFLRAIELNPKYAQARCWYALFSLQWMRGRHREAIDEARRAHEGDPLSAYTTSLLALVLGSAGETAEALRVARAGAERDPDSLLSHWVQGLVAHWHGEYEESVAAHTRAAAVSDRSNYPLANMALTYADWGKPKEARVLHEELLSLQARTYVPHGSIAMSSAAIGDMAGAFDLLHQSCDERESVALLYARLMPEWDRFRADPRFAGVLARLNLPT
jgi:serine/threonine protein kinase/tetratricopeptide (TPR) repeat protein